jgi:hypothetical protein
MNNRAFEATVLRRQSHTIIASLPMMEQSELEERCCETESSPGQPKAEFVVEELALGQAFFQPLWFLLLIITTASAPYLSVTFPRSVI